MVVYMEEVKVAVILVNYNALEVTEECIDSIKQSDIPVDIIVIDNASMKNEAGELQSKYPDIQCIRSEENLGFAGGNNIGIRLALEHNNTHIALINNDTIIDSHMLSRLVHKCSNSQIAVPVIYYYSAPKTVWYAGGEINSKTGAVIHYFENTAPQNIQSRTCNFATGCCFMAEASIWKRIGLLNESYFMYSEDVEFCLRLLQKKVTINLVPDAKMWHKVGFSSGGDFSPLTIYYATRNRFRNIHRYSWYFAKSAFWYTLITRLIYSIKLQLKGNKDGKLYMKAYRDFKKECRNED